MREFDPRPMEKREMKGEIEDEVMEEEKEIREFMKVAESIESQGFN